MNITASFGTVWFNTGVKVIRFYDNRVERFGTVRFSTVVKDSSIASNNSWSFGTEHVRKARKIIKNIANVYKMIKEN